MRLFGGVTSYSLVCALVLAQANVGPAAETFPTFTSHVIDPEIGKVCYAVTLADVDGDGQDDIVAVGDVRVRWYRAPDWRPRTIIEGQTPKDNVCLAPADIDGDGQVDFALGAGWTTIGSLHWLRRGASLDEPWEVRSIGEERWLHRTRFADVLGKGKPQLVISPLNATQGSGVRLTAFEILADPTRDRWPATVMDSDLNAMHNHWHTDFDSDGTIDTLTASREGIHLIRRSGDGWSRTKLGTGAVAADPAKSGAGEIKTGRFKDGSTFITAVEPMHGDTLSVYTAPAANGELWTRHVIDRGFVRGHALWTADLDGDGGDEIIFGHSDTPNVPGVQVYRATDKSGANWQQHVIDAGGMATEDLIVGDVTGDGRPDIIAGGRATRNVKLYVNGE
ncbi:MAG: VCBS repeat-containing protein [Pirellulales bacterium]|nr:VCBS repeat-containing protein [Pirellulales bacterium]